MASCCHRWDIGPATCTAGEAGCLRAPNKLSLLPCPSWTSPMPMPSQMRSSMRWVARRWSRGACGGLTGRRAAVSHVRVPFLLSVAVRSLKFIPPNGRTIERPISGLVQVNGSVARMPLGRTVPPPMAPVGRAGPATGRRRPLPAVCGQREALRRVGFRRQYLPPVTSDNRPKTEELSRAHGTRREWRSRPLAAQ